MNFASMRALPTRICLLLTLLNLFPALVQAQSTTPPTPPVVVTPPPVANPVAASVQANSGANAIAASISGGPADSVAISSAPTRGSASAGGLGLVYTPPANFVGNDGFSYVASGPGGTSAPASVSVTVVAAPPTAATATLNVPYATAGSIDLASFVSGPSFTGVTVAVSAAPAHGSASVSGSRLTYTPAAGFTGNDQLSYVATAVGGQSAPALLLIVVGAPPDPRTQPGVVGMLRVGAAAARHHELMQIESVQSRLSEIAGRTRDGSRRPGCEKIGMWGSGQGGRGSVGGLGNEAVAYRSQGLTLGGDRCFGSSSTVGIGIGFGRDRADLPGEGATESQAKSASTYGSFDLLPQLKLAWMVGGSQVRFDYDRQVAGPGSEVVRAAWSGRQWLGSFSGSYSFETDNLTLTPYGRIDTSRLEVDAYAESGGGPFALKYESQRLNSRRVSLGMKGEYRYETDFGSVVPRARFEYQRDFAQRRETGISYAALPGGQVTQLGADEQQRRSVIITLGADVNLREGLHFGLHHTFGRSNGGHDSNMTQLRASQNF